MPKGRYTMLALLIAMITCSSCTSLNLFHKGEQDRYVLIETNYGNMKVRLYKETPKHRDNFIKLVEEGFYDSLLFHRVIEDFMIQGGDPDSKGAAAGEMLGNGGPGYQIDAEFNPALFHKKGALCAARQGDQTNPAKKSSGSQFYIVQGKPVDEKQLEQMCDRVNFPIKRKLVFDYVEQPGQEALKAKVDSLKRARDFETLTAELDKVAVLVDSAYLASDLYTYTPEQVETYKTWGGTPHLDRNYTVFGEVVEGLEVIDAIAAVQTGKADRPVKDVVMKMTVVRK